jgi:rare lipoprotein A
LRRLPACLLAGLLGIAGCVRHRPPAPVVAASPHYELGAAFQADGHWFYPREDFSLDTTGIASVETLRGGLTADGERQDPTALVAAMQTIQLPCIVEVTNLDNGRQIAVRVNDRGPDTPSRVIALSPRAALLLALPESGAARVRVRVDEALSRAVIEQVGGGPRLAIASAPTGIVSAESLPPPGSGQPARPAARLGVASVEPAGPRVPERLPEMIHQYRPDPGQLWLRAGSFGRFDYANALAARLAGLGGDVLQTQDGRQRTYAVRAGPFRSIAEADGALAQAFRRGAVDAHITVE